MAPKGKGKGTKGGNSNMPAGLQGFSSRNAQGEAICYAYNLSGCAVAGAKCPKGNHQCIKCHGAHGLPACPLP